MDKAKLAKQLGLPRSVITGETRIHMEGDARLMIEAHQGLMEYGPSRLRVRAKDMTLIIDGAELMMEALTAEDLVVLGRIDQITFHKVGG